MDTVGAGAMKDPFVPLVREGRVYGRGAYDMKGSLAAIMLTAREAKKLRLRGDLIIAIEVPDRGRPETTTMGRPYRSRRDTRLRSPIDGLVAGRAHWAVRVVQW